MDLKFYEFAGKIVGKCLYESSLGGGYRQLVKARFSRSFLAQLIGLRVHFRVSQRSRFCLICTVLQDLILNELVDYLFI